MYGGGVHSHAEVIVGRTHCRHCHIQARGAGGPLAELLQLGAGQAAQGGGQRVAPEGERHMRGRVRVSSETRITSATARRRAKSSTEDDSAVARRGWHPWTLRDRLYSPTLPLGVLPTPSAACFFQLWLPCCPSATRLVFFSNRGLEWPQVAAPYGASRGGVARWRDEARQRPREPGRGRVPGRTHSRDCDTIRECRSAVAPATAGRRAPPLATATHRRRRLGLLLTPQAPPGAAVASAQANRGRSATVVAVASRTAADAWRSPVCRRRHGRWWGVGKWEGMWDPNEPGRCAGVPRWGPPPTHPAGRASGPAGTVHGSRMHTTAARHARARTGGGLVPAPQFFYAPHAAPSRGRTPLEATSGRVPPQQTDGLAWPLSRLPDYALSTTGRCTQRAGNGAQRTSLPRMPARRAPTAGDPHVEHPADGVIPNHSAPSARDDSPPPPRLLWRGGLLHVPKHFKLVAPRSVDGGNRRRR